MRRGDANSAGSGADCPACALEKDLAHLGYGCIRRCRRQGVVIGEVKRHVREARGNGYSTLSVYGNDVNSPVEKSAVGTVKRVAGA